MYWQVGVSNLGAHRSV